MLQVLTVFSTERALPVSQLAGHSGEGGVRIGQNKSPRRTTRSRNRPWHGKKAAAEMHAPTPRVAHSREGGWSPAAAAPGKKDAIEEEVRAGASEEGDKLVLWCHKQQACFLLGAEDVRGFYRVRPAAGKQPGSMCALHLTLKACDSVSTSPAGAARHTLRCWYQGPVGGVTSVRHRAHWMAGSCIPRRPISMPWLPAEAANSTEGCCGNGRSVRSPYQVQGTCGLLVRAETKLSPGTP